RGRERRTTSLGRSVGCSLLDWLGRARSLLHEPASLLEDGVDFDVETRERGIHRLPSTRRTLGGRGDVGGDELPFRNRRGGNDTRKLLAERGEVHVTGELRRVPSGSAGWKIARRFIERR